MIFKDPLLRREFSGLRFCLGCGAARICQCHHLFCKGFGGGFWFDVRWNLGSMCTECHASHHDGNEPTRATLLKRVAAREHTTVKWIREQIREFRKRGKQ